MLIFRRVWGETTPIQMAVFFMGNFPGELEPHGNMAGI